MVTGYLLAKFVHLSGALLWLGSALALGLVHLGAPPPETDEGRRVRRLLRRASAVEHAGFLLLLVGAGGLLAGVGGPFLGLPLWIRAKTYLTVSIALPLEVLEMTFVHGWLRPLSVAAARDPSALPRFVEGLRRYDAFRRGALPFLALLLPTYLVLAVFRLP